MYWCFQYRHEAKKTDLLLGLSTMLVLLVPGMEVLQDYYLQDRMQNFGPSGRVAHLLRRAVEQMELFGLRGSGKIVQSG